MNSTKLDDANLAHVIGVESKTIPVEARNVALQDAIAFEDALAGLNRTEQIKRFNAFAKKYGYEEIGEGVSDEVLDKATKEMLERHNTFFRGVRPSEEVTNLATKLGISEEEALKIAATTPRAGETHVFVSPTNNAGIYGGAEYVAQVRRPYELGNDRTQWFNEANFEITPGIYSNGNEYFIDPWFSSTSGTTEIPNELLMKKGEFVDWVRGPLEGNGSNNRIFRKYNRALEIYEPEDLVKFANGGRVNRFDIGGDKDPWYKRLYSWIFNDDNTEETTPQENKYLTNDNYLDEVSKFISTFEEFYPNAYEDTHKGKNIWTVGSGLTYLLDDEGNEIRVKKGDTITKEENINQLNKRLQKNIDYVKSKTQYWDNYPAELKFQLLDAIYNIGATKVWNPETNYIKAIRQYENEKGWENPEYDLKNIFQHADWNLNNKGWLGIRSRMRRNPQSINAEDFSKIYQNNYRDSLRTAYDIKFQNN